MTERFLPPTVIEAPTLIPALAIDPNKAEEGLRLIKKFQQVVHKLLVRGVDYGRIPGTDKDTLFKPGAEKVAKLMALADSYEIMERIEDYDKPLFAYTIRCRLSSIQTGDLVSQGVGQCNSMESKYRYRWVWPSDVPEDYDKTTLKIKTWKKGARKFAKYRIENDDIYSQVNTILKMSKKRAMVDATLSAARLSELFTQDLEDTSEESEQNGDSENTVISEQQRDRMSNLCKQVALPSTRLKKFIKEAYGVETMADIPVKFYDPVCAWIMSQGKEGKQGELLPRDPGEEG